MSAPDLPPVDALLPQSGPMRLLARVLAHDATETRCEVDASRAALFRDEEGLVPPWVALEWLAQCVAAHAGLVARARGERPRPGLLLGTRRLRLACGGLAPEARLVAVARPLRFATSGAGAFACRLEPGGAPERGAAAEAAGEGAPLAEGTLTVYAPEGLEGPAAPGGGASASGVEGSGAGPAAPSGRSAGPDRPAFEEGP